MSHIKTYNDQPSILTEDQQNELQISTNGLQNKLNKLENDVKLKLVSFTFFSLKYLTILDYNVPYRGKCQQ